MSAPRTTPAARSKLGGLHPRWHQRCRVWPDIGHQRHRVFGLTSAPGGTNDIVFGLMSATNDVVIGLTSASGGDNDVAFGPMSAVPPTMSCLAENRPAPTCPWPLPPEGHQPPPRSVETLLAGAVQLGVEDAARKDCRLGEALPPARGRPRVAPHEKAADGGALPPQAPV